MQFMLIVAKILQISVTFPRWSSTRHKSLSTTSLLDVTLATHCMPHPLNITPNFCMNIAHTTKWRSWNQISSMRVCEQDLEAIVLTSSFLGSPAHAQEPRNKLTIIPVLVKWITSSQTLPVSQSCYHGYHGEDSYKGLWCSYSHEQVKMRVYIFLYISLVPGAVWEERDGLVSTVCTCAIIPRKTRESVYVWNFISLKDAVICQLNYLQLHKVVAWVWG